MDEPTRCVVPWHEPAVEKQVSVSCCCESILMRCAAKPVGHSQPGEISADDRSLRLWKKVRTDDCVHLVQRNRLGDVKGPVSTMMACPGQTPREQFVQVRGDDMLLRYNSRLPLVVYVPDGFEVRYRVWRAAREAGKAIRQ